MLYIFLILTFCDFHLQGLALVTDQHDDKMQWTTDISGKRKSDNWNMTHPPESTECRQTSTHQTWVHIHTSNMLLLNMTNVNFKLINQDTFFWQCPLCSTVGDWFGTAQTHVSCVEETCHAPQSWQMNYIAIVWLLVAKTKVASRNTCVTLGSHVWACQLCLKLFSKNLGHMLPKFTGVCSWLNQQVFDTSEAAIVIPCHQRWSRDTCIWPLT